MTEGILGKWLPAGNDAKKSKSGKIDGKTTANGEKKSMKSEDYPEDSKFYSEKNQPHAVLEVDGAEIEEPYNSDSVNGKAQSMFPDKTISHGNLEEFEINPRLEVTSELQNNGLLNEAGIEKAVEEALKQRSDQKASDRESEVAFMGSEKHNTSGDLEGHGTETSNHENKQVEQEQPTGTQGNNTTLEMDKIAKEAGQVAMNLVNVTNFKVVIPGGKTYEISGSPGKKPLVTVVPDERKQIANQAVDKLNGTISSKANLEKKTNNESKNELPDGRTVTAVQHGNQIDIHVDKKDANHVMQMPQIETTKMDNAGAPMESPLMSAPLLEHPHPILDSSIASLMYDQDHMAHPISDHNEHHIDDMHIEVNSSVPVHETPKAQKLDPEVIKVEFLPEGISVDTASSKITKKCNQKISKRSKQSSDCIEESESKNEIETERANLKSISNADQANEKSNNVVAGKVENAPDAKMFVAPVMMKGGPGDVTVVPAERQEAVTRVLVQETAREKNESRMNIVKVAPVNKVAEQSEFPVSNEIYS